MDADAGDILSVGLPVYSFTKDIVEAIAKGCGMDDKDAKALGISVGAGVSITTAVITGCP